MRAAAQSKALTVGDNNVNVVMQHLLQTQNVDMVVNKHVSFAMNLKIRYPLNPPRLLGLYVYIILMHLTSIFAYGFTRLMVRLPCVSAQ